MTTGMTTKSTKPTSGGKYKFKAPPKNDEQPPPAPLSPPPPIPANIAVVRRRIHIAINKVQKEVSDFRKIWMRDVTERKETWPEYVETVSLKAKADKNIQIPFSFFFELLDSLYENERFETLTQRAEHSDMKALQERHIFFQETWAKIKKRLKYAINHHLEKFCISFYEEAAEEDIGPVQECECKLIRLRHRMNHEFNIIKTNENEISLLLANIMEYVKDYNKFVFYVDNLCEAVSKLCALVLEWLVLDEGYSRRLQSEIVSSNLQKMKLRDEMKQLQYRKGNTRIKIHRRTYNSTLIQERIEKKRYQESTIIKRESTARMNYSRAEHQLEVKLQCLKDLQIESKKSKLHNPSLHRDINRALQRISDDIKGLEQFLVRLERDIAEKQVQQTLVYSEIHDLETKKEDGRLSQNMEYDHYAKHERSAKNVQEEMKQLENRLRVLRRIRDLKLSHDTVRKIYQEGFASIVEVQDDFDSALKFISINIGKDFYGLYHALPFEPIRDRITRNRDIEEFDLSLMDGGWQEITRKCLDKWRQLSLTANTQTLIKALRTLKKMVLVRKLEQNLYGGYRCVQPICTTHALPLIAESK